MRCILRTRGSCRAPAPKRPSPRCFPGRHPRLRRSRSIATFASVGPVQAVHYSNASPPSTARAAASLSPVADPIAEFDATQQADNARDAQAKFDDLSHQADQQVSESLMLEKRASDLKQAEADLSKAEMEVAEDARWPEMHWLK